MPPARFAPRSWGSPAPCSRGCLYGVPAGGAEPGGSGSPPLLPGGFKEGTYPRCSLPWVTPWGTEGRRASQGDPQPKQKGWRGRGGEAQHGPRADEMLCQGSSSAGGHGEGQPAQGAGPPPNAALGPAAGSPGGARPLPGAGSQHRALKCPPGALRGAGRGQGSHRGLGAPVPAGCHLLGAEPQGWGERQAL